MSIRVMTRVWEQSKQQGSALVVLLAIADFANDEGVAYPSVATLGTKARISESQVHWILRKLIEEDELTIQRNAGPHRCNLYIITDNRVRSSEGAADNKKRVRPVAPDPSIDPSGGDAPSVPSSVPTEPSSVSTGVAPTPKVQYQPRKTSITSEFIAKMVLEYPDLDVADQLDKAMAHESYTKWHGKQRWFEDWLKRALTPHNSARPPQDKWGAGRVQIDSDRARYEGREF
jgi:hypothetical protein